MTGQQYLDSVFDSVVSASITSIETIEAAVNAGSLVLQDSAAAAFSASAAAVRSAASAASAASGVFRRPLLDAVNVYRQSVLTLPSYLRHDSQQDYVDRLVAAVGAPLSSAISGFNSDYLAGRQLDNQPFLISDFSGLYVADTSPVNQSFPVVGASYGLPFVSAPVLPVVPVSARRVQAVAVAPPAVPIDGKITPSIGQAFYSAASGGAWVVAWFDNLREDCQTGKGFDWVDIPGQVSYHFPLTLSPFLFGASLALPSAGLWACVELHQGLLAYELQAYSDAAFGVLVFDYALQYFSQVSVQRDYIQVNGQYVLDAVTSYDWPYMRYVSSPAFGGSGRQTPFGSCSGVRSYFDYTVSCARYEYIGGASVVPLALPCGVVRFPFLHSLSGCENYVKNYC